jgi:molecular chaperone GrpE
MKTSGAHEQDAGTSSEPEAISTPEAEAVSTPQEQAEQLAAEWEDRCKRAVAELNNMRKRYVQDLDHERSVARNETLAAWLPILDNLELALTHAGADPAAIIEGVRSVRDQAVDLLAKLGYPRQDDVGVAFDPNLHEVVALVENGQVPPGNVAQVLRPGYGIGRQQLRPAAVTVAKPQE